jgi:hypothetical protein
MNWQRSTKPACRPEPYRPKLDALEDRLLLASLLRIRWGLGSLNVAASLNIGFGDVPITEQSPGSTDDQWAGRLQIEADLVNNTLQLLGGPGNNIVARTLNSYQPDINGVAGSAPANYGGRFTLFGDPNNFVALREMIVEMTSGVLPLTPQGGGVYTFPSTQTVNLKQGQLDYQTSNFGSGRTGFTGTATNAAADGTFSITPAGGYSLTFPIDVTIVTSITGGSATSHVTGTLGGVVLPPPSPMPGPGHSVDGTLFAGKETPAVAPTTQVVATVSAPTHNQATPQIPDVATPIDRQINVVKPSRIASVDTVFADPVSIAEIL